MTYAKDSGMDITLMPVLTSFAVDKIEWTPMWYPVVTYQGQQNEHQYDIPFLHDVKDSSMDSIMASRCNMYQRQQNRQEYDISL